MFGQEVQTVVGGWLVVWSYCQASSAWGETCMTGTAMALSLDRQESLERADNQAGSRK